MSEHKICKHLTVHNLAPGMNQVYCGDCEYSYSVLVEVEPYFGESDKSAKSVGELAKELGFTNE